MLNRQNRWVGTIESEEARAHNCFQLSSLFIKVKSITGFIIGVCDFKPYSSYLMFSFSLRVFARNYF